MGTTAESVAGFFSRLADSWSTNDGTAFADNFSEDGSLINPFGERADGRSAVAAMYSAYFSGMLKGTRTTIALDSVRSVEADHALADAEQKILAANGEVLLALHVTNLLRRDGEGWRLVDSRPYAFSTPPA